MDRFGLQWQQRRDFRLQVHMADIRHEALLPPALLVLRDDLPLQQGVLFLQLRYLTAQGLDRLLQLLDHADVLLLQTHRLQHRLLLNLPNFFFLLLRNF